MNHGTVKGQNDGLCVCGKSPELENCYETL